MLVLHSVSAYYIQRGKHCSSPAVAVSLRELIFSEDSSVDNSRTFVIVCESCSTAPKNLWIGLGYGSTACLRCQSSSKFKTSNTLVIDRRHTNNPSWPLSFPHNASTPSRDPGWDQEGYAPKAPSPCQSHIAVTIIKDRSRVPARSTHSTTTSSKPPSTPSTTTTTAGQQRQ